MNPSQIFSYDFSKILLSASEQNFQDLDLIKEKIERVLALISIPISSFNFIIQLGVNRVYCSALGDLVLSKNTITL